MICTKVILNVDGKEIEMTIKDAEKLYQDLDKIFGKKVIALSERESTKPWESKPFPPYVWYTLSSGDK